MAGDLIKFVVPADVRKRALKLKGKMTPTSAPQDFRIIVILATRHIEPEHGHFVLSKTNNGKKNLSLVFSYSCQQCPKLAILQEDGEGCTIKIDGVYKCLQSTIQDVIQSKVTYIKFFQGTNPLTSLSATELKALKSVADKIDRGLDPLPSVNDNIALLNKFGPETVERIAKRYYEPTAQVFYAEQVPEEGPEDVHQQAAPPQDPTPQASSPEEPTSDTSTSNAPSNTRSFNIRRTDNNPG